MAVDISVWLHAFASIFAVEYHTEKKYDNIATRVQKRAQAMRDKGVTPYFVFDADRPLPGKLVTKHRNNKRKLAEERIEAALKINSKPDRSLYSDAVRITSELKQYVICQVLVPHGYSVIVAPYEADSQMAHLQRTKVVDVLWSLDSDLVVHDSGPVLLSKVSGKAAWPAAHLYRREALTSCTNTKRKLLQYLPGTSVWHAGFEDVLHDCGMRLHKGGRVWKRESTAVHRQKWKAAWR